MLINLKQFGKFNTFRAFSREFARWLLQVPSMNSAERIFLCSKGLKYHIRIEVERAMPPSLTSAMIIADRMYGIYSQTSTFSRNL